MIIATWNINSIRMRLPRLVSYLQRRQPDVLCLQETKVVDDDFPVEAIRGAGYEVVFRGQKTYNGVAILSRRPCTDVVRAMPDEGPDAEARLLAAGVDGVQVVNVYVPNGGEVGSAKYAFKLEWLARLRQFLDSSFRPGSPLAVCGDYNVAPEDRDVWDPEQWRGQILCSDPERRALAHVQEWGLQDSLRLHRRESGIYTWWDYRGGAFHRGWGLRIDHILVSAPLATRCSGVEVDRDERKGEKPSDHAPVVATFSGAGI